MSGLHISPVPGEGRVGAEEAGRSSVLGELGLGQEACRLLLRPLWALCPRL